MNPSFFPQRPTSSLETLKAKVPSNSSLLPSHSQDANTEQEIYEAFNMFDKDCSKSITKEELRHVMQNLGTSLSEKDVAEMITEVVVVLCW